MQIVRWPERAGDRYLTGRATRHKGDLRIRVILPARGDLFLR